jgi:hypothetical protein
LERTERSVAGVGNVRELRVEFGGSDTVHARMHVAKWHRRHLDVDTDPGSPREVFLARTRCSKRRDPVRWHSASYCFASSIRNFGHADY